MPGISVHKVADRVEEVQAKSDEVISQLQALKLHVKSLEPVAVYEDSILKQIDEQKVRSKISLELCLCFVQPLKLPLFHNRISVRGGQGGHRSPSQLLEKSSKISSNRAKISP